LSLRIGGFATLLQVFDMPTSLAFYRDVLGFQVASEVPEDGRCDWVMLTLHGSELMLNTAYEAHERPSAPDPARIAAHQDVTLFFDCEDVDAVSAYLRELNVVANRPTIAGYGMKQLYLKDPDGYEICFQHPVRESGEGR
jgi:catechol 2,3-dioxygenase-like lactoylglutathione lyase family enzyme